MPKTVTPLPQLIQARLNRALKRSEVLLWEETMNLAVQVGPLNESFISIKEAQAQEFQTIQPGTCFGKKQWTQIWFKIDIPEANRVERGRRYLHWNAGGETTVYIDNQPWCGLDACHPWCLLPDQAGTLWLDCGLYQTEIWCGDKPNPDRYGFFFKEASLRLRNEEAWRLYHDLDVLNQLIDHHLNRLGVRKPVEAIRYVPSLESCPTLLRKLLRRISDALDLLDMEGIKAGCQAVSEIFSDFPAESWSGKISYVGHSHIDLVWLWPEVITYRKAIHTYSTVMRLIERYPEFVFSMSQPPLINFIRDSEPELYDQITEKIKEGAFEATGVLEVECDNLLPVGESLIRTFLYGQEDFKKIRGDTAKVVWLPDVFGYSQCLPQICSLAGIEYFYTTKISWSRITRFPHQSFVWQGPDGSEVLAHLARTSYNSEAGLAEAVECMEKNNQAGVSDEILIAAGYGDGGGGPTEKHCERIRRMRDLASVPRACWSSAEDYFRRLSRDRNNLPLYCGELYLELHRGTYTTQSELKYWYRSAEKALQTFEATEVVLKGAKLPEKAWRRVIFAQFHDALPGSSIKEVYDEMVPELRNISLDLAEEARKKWQASLPGENICFFNQIPLSRSVLIEIPVANKEAELIPYDLDGKELLFQLSKREDRERLLVSLDLDGLESKELVLKSGKAQKNKTLNASPRNLSNGLIEAEFDDQGRVVSITSSGKNLEISSPCYFSLHFDHPAEFDAWDIDHSAKWLFEPVSNSLELKVIEEGPVRSALQGSCRLGKQSEMIVNFAVEAGLPYLLCDLKIDWKEEHSLLRFHVPTAYRHKEARYGCPFGSIDRRQLPGDEQDEAMWEVPASRWMSLGPGDGSGIALITEAKYGFSCQEGLLGLSLLRSPRNPDPTADIGQHKIRFALGAHFSEAEEKNFSTAVAAEVLYTTPLPIPLGSSSSIPFKLNRIGSVVPSWTGPLFEDNGYFVRMHEVAGKRSIVEVDFIEEPKKVMITDLLGKEIGNVEKLNSTSYRLKVSPYQIVSMVIKRS